MTQRLDHLVTTVEEQLINTDETTASPVLIMLSGLPGSGKSHLARRLAEVVPFVVIESDKVRKMLFPEPRYTGEESYWVHRTCHALMAKLLKKGVRVIYDATNLHERNREFVYRLARNGNVKLIIVKTVAPAEVALERLQKRHRDGGPQEDSSDADLKVHRRMAGRSEPIGRNYVTIDTSTDLDSGITRLLRMIRT